MLKVNGVKLSNSACCKKRSESNNSLSFKASLAFKLPGVTTEHAKLVRSRAIDAIPMLEDAFRRAGCPDVKTTFHRTAKEIKDNMPGSLVVIRTGENTTTDYWGALFKNLVNSFKKETGIKNVDLTTPFEKENKIIQLTEHPDKYLRKGA